MARKPTPRSSTSAGQYDHPFIVLHMSDYHCLPVLAFNICHKTPNKHQALKKGEKYEH
jgi:hypothetical protein